MRPDAPPDLAEIRAELKRLVIDAFSASAAGVDLRTMPDDVPILDLGISSLALVEGMRRVFDHFGVLVSIRRVIEGQVTLGGLALYIEQELRTQKTARKAAVAQTWVVQREAALDRSQAHIAFLSRYSSEAAAAYNEALVVHLAGELHGPAILAALEETANRFEALRTALSPERDLLIVGEGQPLEVRVAATSLAQIPTRLGEIVSRPFEPGKRLFRAELLRVGEAEHYLALVGHALVLDSQALALALAETSRLYRVFARDQAAPAPLPCLQWADYLALGSTSAAHTAQQQAQAYWKARFADSAPRLELPTDFPRPPLKKYAGARQSLPLAASLQTALPTWTAAHAISVESALFAACALYLNRLAGSESVVLGVESEPLYLDTGLPAAARTRNMLPVPVGFDPEQDFADYAQAQHRTLAEANAHKVFSFTDLIRTLDLPRDQSRSALYTVAFRVETIPTPPDFGEAKAAILPQPSAGARYDLEFVAQTGPKGIQVMCEYSTELFEEATIARWLQNLQTMLAAGVADGSQACGALPIVSPAEQDLILKRWNDTARPLPTYRSVLDVISKQAAQHPNQPALRFGEENYTYAQLIDRTHIITAALRSAGAGPGQRVGVLLHRSLDLVPAMLAAWGCGAVLVPLDTAFPVQRLAFMLTDSGVRIVLTSRSLLPLLDQAASTRPVLIETVFSHSVNGSGAFAAPSQKAQILFTSGSTGKPKGVEIHHRALLNVLLDTQAMLLAGPECRMLALTTTSFDISTAELYMPLMAGGFVEVGEEGLAADGLALAERIAARRPTHMQGTPSTLKNLLAAGWQGDSSLCLMSAGEALTRELAEALLLRCGRLWNLYGPTETTVYSAGAQVSRAPGKPVRIGRPLANNRLYVLDARRQPLPLGAVGELYIGGVGVSPGYWNRPDLTTARFVPNPLQPGERMYRTGDLARWLPDGELVCLGRSDDQVKIHGVRIELGEIETTLRAFSGVRDAVVTPWQDSHGDPQLVAHIITTEESLDPAALRAHLRAHLPEVMVPPYILTSAAFPLTANGKIHRAALPTPATHTPEAPALAFEPPATPTERSLAEAWALVLGIETRLIGRQSDFMALGGHSLLMTRLMLEVRSRFDVTFKMREFFGASTLSLSAALIDTHIQQHTVPAEMRQPALPARSAEWARQRMAFLAREGDLPQYIAPARGLVYEPGGSLASVFLTGATGFLGAYIVAEILQTTQSDLFCLVRPKRGEKSKQRIERQMRHYAVWPQGEAWQHAWDTRLHVVEGDVTLPRMGLADVVYETLARQVDAIFHGAAHVNFIYPYEALRATNVLGLHEIIQFAFHTRIKPVHHLSTAAIWPMGAQYTFRERDSIDHFKLLNLGYDEAKWVGEKCLLHAAERGLPVARYRPGEVGGDSVTGRCVTDHFLIASIKGFLQFGAFPQLDIEVDVAPVDYVAKAMVFMAFRRQPLGRAFHLTNPSRRTMRQALTFLRGLGYAFVELPFEELRDRLVSSPDFASNALFAYQAALEDMNEVSMQLPTYDTRDAQRELQGSGIVCAPADEKLFETYFNYLRDCGFMPDPKTTREGMHA